MSTIRIAPMCNRVVFTVATPEAIVRVELEPDEVDAIVDRLGRARAMAEAGVPAAGLADLLG